MDSCSAEPVMDSFILTAIRPWSPTARHPIPWISARGHKGPARCSTSLTASLRRKLHQSRNNKQDQKRGSMTPKRPLYPAQGSGCEGWTMEGPVPRGRVTVSLGPYSTSAPCSSGSPASESEARRHLMLRSHCFRFVRPCKAAFGYQSGQAQTEQK